MRRRHQRRRRLARNVAVLLAAFTLASTLPISAAAAEGPDLRVDQPDRQDTGEVFPPQLLAQPKAVVWPGGKTFVAGAVMNASGTPLGAPVVLTVDSLPAGITFDTALVTPGSDLPFAWSCGGDGASSASCQLVDAESDEPAAVPAQGFATWQLVLDVDPATDPAALSAVVVSVTTGSATPLAPVSIDLVAPEAGSAPVFVSASAPVEALHEDPLEVTYAVTNLGSEPLLAGQLQLQNVMHVDAETVVTSGSGWDCQPDATDPGTHCSWIGEPIAPGDTTPELLVTSTHLELALAEYEEGRTLQWDAEAVTTQGTELRTARTIETTLSAGAQPTGTLVAEIESSIAFVAPDVVAMRIDVVGTHLDNASGTVSFGFELPVGFSLVSAVGEDWECGPTADGALLSITCARTEPFAAAATDDDIDSAVDLSIAVAEDAEPDRYDIAFALTVPGEPADEQADNMVTASLVLAERPEPILRPAVYAVGGSATDPVTEVVTDGSSVAMVRGESFGIGAQNFGSGVAERGDEVTLALTLPPGVELSPSSGDWTCVSTDIEATPLPLGSTVACALSLDQTVEPGDHLPVAVFDVVHALRSEGALSLPIALTHANGDPTALSAHAVVEHNHAKLSVGDPVVRFYEKTAGIARVPVTNYGSDTADGWEAVLSLETSQDVAWGDLSLAVLDTGSAAGANGANLGSADNAIDITCIPYEAPALGLFDPADGAVVQCRSDAALAPETAVELIIPVAAPLAAATGELAVFARTDTVASDVRRGAFASDDATVELTGSPDASSAANPEVRGLAQLVVPFQSDADGAGLELTGSYPDFLLRASLLIGATGATTTYTFERCIPDLSCWTVVQAASDQPTYEVQPDDWGTQMRVRVVTQLRGVDIVDDGFVIEALSNTIDIPVAPPTFLEAPSVSIDDGHGPTVGAVVRVDPGQWDNVDSTSIHWQRCYSGGDLTGCSTIAGEAGMTYRLSANDVDVDPSTNVFVQPVLSVTNASYSQSSELEDVGPVVAVPPTLLSPPTITGNAAGVLEPGNVITLSPGTWDEPATDRLTGNGSWTHQWQRCDDAEGTSCAPIDGASDLDYVVTTDDVGFRLRVRETASTEHGITASAESSTTSVVRAEPEPEPEPEQEPAFDSSAACQLLADLAPSGATVSLGSRLSMSAGTWSLDTNDCGASSTVTFSNAALTIDGAISLTRASGSISASGIRFSSGSVSIEDSGFGGLTFSLAGDGLGIAFPTGGTYAVEGDLVASGLAGVALPDGWEGAVRLRFVARSTGQRIDVDAVAHESTPDPVPDVGGLPQPTGVPTLRLAGSLASSGDLSLNAELTGLIQIGGAEIDLSGSVQRTGRNGAVVTTVTGQLADPIDIASGVTINSAAVTWSDGIVTGAAIVSIGELVLEGDLTYQSADAWSVAISANTGDDPVTLAPGFIIRGAAMEGSVTQSRTALTAEVDASVSRWELGDGSGVVLENASFEVSARCPNGGSCSTTIDIAGTFEFNFGTDPLTIDIAGTVDSASGDFEASAALSSVPTPPGLTLDNLRLVLARESGATTSRVEADVTVLGTTVSGTFDFVEGGIRFEASLDQWTPVPGSPAFSDVQLVYATVPFAVDHGDRTQRYAAGTLAVAGTMDAPTWLEDLIGQPLQATAAGTIDLSTGEISLSAPLPALSDTNLLDFEGVRVDIDAVALTVTSAPGGVGQELSGDVALHVPGGGVIDDIDLDLRIAAGVEAGPAGAAYASMSLAPGVSWSNAFGISGLDIDALTIAIDMRPGGPTLGFSATASLPSALTEPLGINAGTPISLAASIGVGPKCFAFEIGRTGPGAPTAIDILNFGVVTGRHAQLVLAPTGCSIGSQRFTAGISIAFDGEVLGAGVRVDVAFDPAAGSLDARVELNNVSVVGLEFDDVFVDVRIDPTEQAVSFGGTVDLLGATADVEGSFQRTAAGIDLAFDGRFENLELGGLGIDYLDVEFETSNGMKDLSVDAAGKVGLLTHDVEIDLVLALVNGKVERASGTGALVADIGELSIDAAVEIDYHRQSGFPTVALAGTLAIAGVEMADMLGYVAPEGASLQARLTIDPFVDAVLKGWVAFEHSGSAVAGDAPSLAIGGIPEDARPGDFELRAEDIRIGAGGFELSGSVDASMVAGEAHFGIEADLQLGTADAVGGLVNLEGSIDSVEGIDLQGSGSVQVLGHQLADGEFAVAVAPNGDATVDLEASIDLGGGAAKVRGQFERADTYGTLFRLSGEADVSAGSFDFSTVRLVAVRDIPQRGVRRVVSFPKVNFDDPLVHPTCAERRCDTRAGFVGSAIFEAPAVGDVRVDLAFSANGRIAFWARSKLSGPVGSALGSPTVTIAFDSGSNGVAQLTFKVKIGKLHGIPLRMLVRGTIRSDGYVSVSGEARASWHWELNIPMGISELKAWTRPGFKLGITYDAGRPDSLEISAAIEARIAILVQWVSFVWSCCRSGWNRLFGIVVEGGVNPYFLRFSVEIAAFGSVGFKIR